MTNEDIARFFNTTRPFIQGNPDLRDPQVEGWFRTHQHFRYSSEHAILKFRRVTEKRASWPCCSLTATPFGGDVREITGERLYAYLFRTGIVRDSHSAEDTGKTSWVDSRIWES